MSRAGSILISCGLIGAGLAAWALAGHSLVRQPDLNVPLNPFGINRSPYGEVIAMAMQGPIDTYFDAGITHQHEGGGECAGCATSDNAIQSKDAPAAVSLVSRWENLLGSLDKALEERTNPKPPSEALKRHHRRQAEDQLRFAYQLDPSHYANYNALHFFLTEPQVGTRPELTPSATKLAEETIQYCLKQSADPRPALTAAAAASNVLMLMFDDQHNPAPKYNVLQMHRCLDLLDLCIARYESIAREWDQTKNWDLLSPQRITECAERRHFILKVRDAAAKTIARLDNNPPTSN